MAGLGAIDFVNDIITSLKDNWKSSNVRKPVITKVWKKKQVGLGNKKYSEIIVSVNGENINIFSLKQTDANGNPKYDWLHDISVSLDIWTSESENHSDLLANEAARILKENVIFSENNRTYVQLLPIGSEPLHEDYRNIYRWMVDCEVIRFNP